LASSSEAGMACSVAVELGIKAHATQQKVLIQDAK